MKTLTAITLIQETLEETALKMLKANKKEALEDIEKATDKYLKKAMNLKNKARIYVEENKEEVLKLIEFTLNK